jgi:hypothetical protein
MGQAGPKQVPFMIDEDLGLVFKPAKSRAVDDAVAIPLISIPGDGRSLGMLAPDPLFGVTCVGGKHNKYSEKA